jgi:hypothetical protein
VLAGERKAIEMKTYLGARNSMTHHYISYKLYFLIASIILYPKNSHALHDVQNVKMPFKGTERGIDWTTSSVEWITTP